jgi:hypothetical protein
MTRGVRLDVDQEHLSFSGQDAPMSKLLLFVMGAFAEFERALIHERQPEGIELAKRRGVYRGRHRSLDPDTQVHLFHQTLAGPSKSRLSMEYGISRSPCIGSCELQRVGSICRGAVEASPFAKDHLGCSVEVGTSPEDVEGSLKPRAVGNPATAPVFEELLAPGPCQYLLLNVETLVRGRDTGIAGTHWVLHEADSQNSWRATPTKNRILRGPRWLSECG